MKGYRKGREDPYITVYYNGLIEAYMQGYSKVMKGPFIPVHYNG
jgi:hypothetical protein